MADQMIPITSDTISESGVTNARWGRVGGKRTLITHRNPTNGECWCEDIPDNRASWDGSFSGKQVGKWVPSDKVEFE